MNVLIFTSSDNTILCSNQIGQHQLKPARLTNGTYFLNSDVLSEPLYQGKMNVPYTIKTFAEIQSLIPQSN